jgi:hypothetical protein
MFATKWRNRIARGFSPGCAGKAVRPEGAPEQDFRCAIVFANPEIRQVIVGVTNIDPELRFGRPFRAIFLAT